MRIRDYVQIFAPPPEELRAMQETAKATGASKLSPTHIARIISAARKQQKASTPKRLAK